MLDVIALCSKIPKTELVDFFLNLDSAERDQRGSKERGGWRGKTLEIAIPVHGVAVSSLWPKYSMGVFFPLA